MSNYRLDCVACDGEGAVWAYRAATGYSAEENGTRTCTDCGGRGKQREWLCGGCDAEVDGEDGYCPNCDDQLTEPTQGDPLLGRAA